MLRLMLLLRWRLVVVILVVRVGVGVVGVGVLLLTHPTASADIVGRLQGRRGVAVLLITVRVHTTAAGGSGGIAAAAG